MQEQLKEDTSTKQAILNAALECVGRWGLARFSMADIAKQAKVARSTVYMYFKTRDEVIRAALLQSAYGFGEKLYLHIGQFEGAQERLIEAVFFCVKSMPTEPFLAMVSSSALSDMVREYTLTTPEGMDIGTGIMADILSDKNLPMPELQEMAEFAVRFVLSLITMESPLIKTDADLKGYIARRLLPSVNLSVPEQYQR